LLIVIKEKRKGLYYTIFYNQNLFFIFKLLIEISQPARKPLVSVEEKLVCVPGAGDEQDPFCGQPAGNVIRIAANWECKPLRQRVDSAAQNLASLKGQPREIFYLRFFTNKLSAGTHD
jgi:hypothetical protein